MKKKLIITTVLIGIVAFILGPILWQAAPGSEPEITSGQLPFFIFLGIIESLAFGFAVAIFLCARRKIKNLFISKGGWVHLALVWIIGSWWPHDNFHRVLDKANTQGLLYIEYAFHLTVMAAAILVALVIMTNMKAISED